MCLSLGQFLGLETSNPIGFIFKMMTYVFRLPSRKSESVIPFPLVLGESPLKTAAQQEAKKKKKRK